MKKTIIENMMRLFATIFVLVSSSAAMAAGPLAMCNTGQPFVWPNGGQDVPFNPDQGALGILDNAQATQAVNDAFQAWEDVQTATITYSNMGALPVDVDITNFLPFLQPAAPDGLSAIVFDDTGEIFDALFGAGSGILGFAGPEWLNGADCTILEGSAFLNGPAISSLNGLLDLMVHEFGHYSNLAHSEVNGQLFIGVGDSSGPGVAATFGFPPNPDNGEVIETMYPFLFSNIDQLARTPNADDRSSLSQLYPEPDFAANSASISGTISLGTTKVTGVNVIARNTADPFSDAVSGISSDFTDDFSQANPNTGLYRLNGLTPGASYAVYIDEILAGGFSTPLTSPLPGPEEFYNGANESNDGLLDVPTEFVAVSAAAGSSADNIDIIFNIPPPGSPLPTGDDGNVEVPLPFSYCVAGKAYDSAFINGNGFFTLGAPDNGLTFIESAASFASGPPRIAGYWDDLSPDVAGTVIYENTDSTFTVTWDSVPEFFIGGSNTFSITIRDNSHKCVPGPRNVDHVRGADVVTISLGSLTSSDGLVGVSAGAFATSGFETEIDISEASEGGASALRMDHDSALFELFSANDLDLGNIDLRFERVGREYHDRFEHNDSIEEAAPISSSFDTIDTGRAFSSISPAAGDIDFYRLRRVVPAGTTIVAEILTSQVDTVMGLYFCDLSGSGLADEGERSCPPSEAVLVAGNDDSNGLLSRIQYETQQDGIYTIAVTFCCDYDFDGVDPGQGDPLDHGRYVLDVFTVPGTLLQLSDESFVEYPLGFNFPFQGSSYDSVFINSNGYLTFGGGEVFAFSPNVPDLENGLPRIAPLWADLDPGSGGMIIVQGEAEESYATISFVGVPEFFFGGSNSFSVSLNAAGEIEIVYSGVTAPEGISGVAAGSGLPGTAVDLSSSESWPASGTTYEQFQFGVSEFDLDSSTLIFEP